jgi:4-amino-4-deoxy-L-arabinose transferase-like glycosyltransferase
MSRSHLWFAGLCLLCFILLLATAIPAPFTVDDCNYLSSVASLRHGTLFLPGTAGLPASRALYAFEPTAKWLAHPVTPVPPEAPPLYALLAYPFSYLGGSGLVLLNVLACIATLVVLFLVARGLTGQERAGWFAAAVWLLGASTLEYAQGLWPHLLTAALTTAGLAASALAASRGRALPALAAGFLLALAAGIRYQNAVLLGCGLGIVLVWGRTRLRSAGSLALGALPLVLLSALLNHARTGSWHPWSKSMVYYAKVGAGVAGGQARRAHHDFFLSLWTRIVDYSAQPAYGDLAEQVVRKLPGGDMVTLYGVLKKSWLQASPWVLLGLVAILVAWSRRDCLGALAQRHLRMAVLPVAAIFFVFGMAGAARHDGLCFNQRYFLELAPLLALALAVVLTRLAAGWPWLAAGGLGGAAAAALVLFGIAEPTHYRLQSILPLVLAGVAAGLWLASLLRRRLAGMAGAAVAACLAWSLVVHVSTDVPAARLARYYNTGRLAFVEDLVAERPAALLGASGTLDAFCPLLLDHDLVGLATNSAPATEISGLLDVLLLRRRVFLWLELFPKETLSFLRARYQIEVLRPPMLAEIRR